MRFLTQGGQTAERLELLFSLTRIASDDIKAALSDYLVRGLSDATASSLNGVAQSNFNRALNGLEEVAATVERIKEIDWRNLKSVK